MGSCTGKPARAVPVLTETPWMRPRVSPKKKLPVGPTTAFAVAVLPLVEVIRAAETDHATLATVWDTAKKLRKRPVASADAPAFIVNRVLTRMTTVLMDALENGNTIDETDEAILRLGLPMAPSVLLQMVGPRVAKDTIGEIYLDPWPAYEDVELKAS